MCSGNLQLAVIPSYSEINTPKCWGSIQRRLYMIINLQLITNLPIVSRASGRDSTIMFAIIVSALGFQPQLNACNNVNASRSCTLCAINYRSIVLRSPVHLHANRSASGLYSVSGDIRAPALTSFRTQKSASGYTVCRPFISISGRERASTSFGIVN